MLAEKNPPALSSVRPKVRCRRIGESDLPAAVDLLARGFPARSAAFWQQALSRLSRHALATGAASFGSVLECAGDLVGVLLVIPSVDPVLPLETAGRRNMSSWYVEPAFQAYGAMLLNAIGRDRDVTCINISPATHTRPIIEAQGFRRYGTGRFWAFAAAGAPRLGASVFRFGGGSEADRLLPTAERDLLADHASYGCLSLCASTGEGVEPFVFLPRRTKGVVPTAQLVYCRDVTGFVRLAGPLGRALLRRGIPAVTIDADGAIPGLIGFFADDALPKYFRGPARPRLGNLAYTELAMFGP